MAIKNGVCDAPWRKLLRHKHAHTIQYTSSSKSLLPPSKCVWLSSVGGISASIGLACADRWPVQVSYMLPYTQCLNARVIYETGSSD